MTSQEDFRSSSHVHSYLPLPVKRSLSGGRMRPNNWTSGERHAHQSQPCDSASFSGLSSKSSAALALASENETYYQFFQQYQDDDILKGYELACDKGFFNFLRQYSIEDINLGLRFAREGAMDFFEAFKIFRGSELLDCRHAILEAVGITLGRNSTSWRDSGYESRPLSEFRDSVASSSLLYESSRCSLSLPESSLTQDSQPRDNYLTGPLASALPSYLGASAASPRLPNSPLAALSPYEPSTESSQRSPLDVARNSQTRSFECMYCTKDFVRYGDCQNHEENQHSQRKEWICPHCDLQFKSKAGYDRHHKKSHRCQRCTATERVITLSEPKTSCACQYCGQLFEGEDSFVNRSAHVDSTHYRGEGRKTRSDLNHSGMINGLLGQKSLNKLWKQFMSDKGGVCLYWTPKNARALLEELEFGAFPNGIPSQIHKIYELATKSFTLEKGFSGNSQTNPPYLDLRSKVTISLSPKNVCAPQNASSSTTGFSRDAAQTRTESGKDCVGSVIPLDNIITEGPPYYSSRRDCTITALQVPYTSRPGLCGEIEEKVLPLRRKGSELGLSTPCPENLQHDISMGSENLVSDSGHALSSIYETQNHRSDRTSSLTDSNFLSQSQWKLQASLEHPLSRMEDLMTQHILSSSQSSQPARTIPPRLHSPLPSSLQNLDLEVKTSQSPTVSLQRYPQRHSPRLERPEDPIDRFMYDYILADANSSRNFTFPG
ncbi:hypothetical protein AOQ84DRAFT_409662 [Glonium stellatum]|uniref:C2H2-type domain-containing protein n=1 Tax=Glonium stellatum TaxID=574774 RepID=A0A8E2EY12_9PEZI|nr:hypothetical protein AOQ84DRAFT_409662 [Glonium stellatum]